MQHEETQSNKSILRDGYHDAVLGVADENPQHILDARRGAVRQEDVRRVRGVPVALWRDVMSRGRNKEREREREKEYSV
jgi:hypothetical protein